MPSSYIKTSKSIQNFEFSDYKTQLTFEFSNNLILELLILCNI